MPLTKGAMLNMKKQTPRHLISVLVLVPSLLVAQVAREHDPVSLKPWSAPLYFHLTQAEARANAAADISSPQAQAPPISLVFVGLTPCRVLDTRANSGFTGAFGPPSLVGQASRTFPIQSSPNCSIPSVAQAYSFNVTTVPPGVLGFITVYPTGQPRPLASTLNSLEGFIVANAAIVPAGTSGSVDIFASNPTDVIIDINGYYAPPSGITLAQGTAAAPSISFSGDAGTGIFSSGPGTVNIATAGAGRVTVDNSHVGIIGNLSLSGAGNGIVFPDSTKQTTATAVGPQGPAGPVGPPGPEGPPGPNVLAAGSAAAPSLSFLNNPNT